MSTQTSLEEPSYLDYHGKYKGIFAWIFSTDHKRIGMLYLFDPDCFTVGANRLL
jgi:hypothetical protein